MINRIMLTTKHKTAKLCGLLFAFAVSMICFFNFVYAQSEEDMTIENLLSVNIVSDSGSSILTTKGGVLYLNEGVKISPVINNEAYDSFMMLHPDILGECELSYVDYYRISCVGNEGEYLPLDTQTVNLSPDAYDEGVQYTLFIRREYTINVDEDTCIHILGCAEDLVFCFDVSAPSLEELNDISWDLWVNYVRGCDFLATDLISGIKRVVVIQDEDVIYEKHEDFENCNDFTFSAELSKEATDSGGTCIKVQLTDAAGNTRESDFRYYYDITCPVVNVGGISDGSYNNRDVTALLSGSDTIMSTTFLKYSIHRSYLNDTTVVKDDVIGENNGIITAYETFGDNGDYTVWAKAYDLAGNESQPVQITFRVDKDAPGVIISGFESGLYYNKPISSYFNIEEGFWQDTIFTYEIHRMWPAGSELYAKKELYLSDYSTSLDEYLCVDGDYHITCRATDACGNETSKEAFVRVDLTAPSVVIDGIQNGVATRNIPSVHIKSSEMFYDGTGINAALYKQTQNGNYECELNLNYIMQSDNDDLPVEVKDEGRYLLSVIAIDASGNSSSSDIEFVLDYTPPKVSWLKDIDRKYFKKLLIPDNLQTFISDITGVRLTASLNSNPLRAGQEIDGEGKYVLTIVAVDEAGNESDESAQFIIDNTPPRLIVAGLTKSGAAKQGTDIKISLYDDGDRFEKICYDGKEIELGIGQNEWSVKPDVMQDHKIEVVAVDEAGNRTDKEIVINKASFINTDAIEGVVKTIIDKSGDASSENIKKKTDKKYLYVVIALILAICGGGIAILWRLRRIDTDN